MMSKQIMEKIVETAHKTKAKNFDITGGAPELNPNLQWFIQSVDEYVDTVQVRTNLTVLLEPEMNTFMEFYRDNKVKLVASMPCYLEKNVRAQRGEGVYEKSISAIRELNNLGYGLSPELTLDLVYNPGGVFLPGQQKDLEEAYKKELGERHGICFSHLLTITNMPIGRFKKMLRIENKEQDYLNLLKESFNADNLENLMCRYLLNIGWDGMLYDCDFNLALRLPVDHGAPDHIDIFEAGKLSTRRIVTGEHCFGCTAGFGSSCKGALT